MTDKANGPILYFIEGTVPTNAEFDKGMKFHGKGPILEFVSVPNLDFNKPLLVASGVAGKVPEVYKEKYPIVDKKTAPVIEEAATPKSK